MFGGVCTAVRLPGLSTGAVATVRVLRTGASAVALIAARLPFKGGPGELYPPGTTGSITEKQAGAKTKAPAANK